MPQVEVRYLVISGPHLHISAKIWRHIRIVRHTIAEIKSLGSGSILARFDSSPTALQPWISNSPPYVLPVFSSVKWI